MTLDADGTGTQLHAPAKRFYPTLLPIVLLLYSTDSTLTLAMLRSAFSRVAPVLPRVQVSLGQRLYSGIQGKSA